MSDTSIIHVQLEPEIRRKFTAQAKQLGFGSAQAYLRVLIKAAVDGRRIDLDVDAWDQPSDEAANRLNKATVEARKGVGLSGPFSGIEEFMKDLSS